MVIFCAALALLLFLGMIAYLITSDGKKTIKKQKTSQKQHIAEKIKNFDTDLDKMITTASDTKLSDIELKELSKLYVQTHKLGTKTSKELDEITKKKLEFVAALASNSNASVQTLAYLNKELKKISGSYKKEIDAYEHMGLAKRKIKEDK
ncbi:TPA: hypothetical protein R8Q36_000190 [Campylobacter jejuni]|uniref:Uncharacterized protein n=1 Tax=Campylobacter jejuni TaxID=197 RepID=A0A5T0XV97_CAMJU|nr:hypothetical protein [Campylobacter jejuni]EAH4888467.1 hypothetical protein [Campylobacter jejuni]EAI1780298.1 hypothetical protein [Campylobacter jejuni]EAJ5160624.1 hypothetical protein [Campylobacter jejuni]EAJ8456440.1 hypothetical protein [Campylobacter jejuni]EAJ8706282.1 hypothetical protein [Campylobacter jejuni]